MDRRPYDVAVVGAGSGGIGAALAAARLGCRVVLVEQAQTLGGNAAHGGVNCWEPGVGGTGIPFDIYKRLKRLPNAVGIYRHARHLAVPVPGQPIFPGGESVLDPRLRYVDSLRRFRGGGLAHDWDFSREFCHGVPFEPEAYARVIAEMLAETDRVTVMTGVRFESATVKDRKIESIRLSSGGIVTADIFIDATADIHLAVDAGCAYQLGQESRSAYNEPAAPDEPTDRMNGVTLIYRVDPRGDKPGIDPPAESVPETCWWSDRFPVACFNQYPAGGWNINMLPTMEGREAWRLGPVEARAECRRRVVAHWRDLQTHHPEWQQYTMGWIAPSLGIRETRRLVGRHVLTEHDLLATLKNQDHSDIVCIADHPKDVHGEASRGTLKEVAFPYGVPFRCLLPVEIDNLALACRGASFSSIGGSSCRLSRTMMQLGQAAGTAAALALEARIELPELPADELRSSLRAQHVQLEWPVPVALQAWLENE